MKANFDNSPNFEDLVENDNFKDLKTDAYFCPFEAIGMVRQEIKHSHFLAYILNPHRPHGFDQNILKRLLQIETLQLNPNNYYLTDAIIYRERWHIDILIELPPRTPAQKSHVVAIEMKIDAAEGCNQLSQYKKIIEGEYPDSTHSFIFLTPDGRDPSERNDEWVALGFYETIDALEQYVSEQSKQTQSADLLRSYIAMQRRHILENDELKKQVKKIWAEHEDVLKLLIQHKPDFQGEIFDDLNSAVYAQEFAINDFTLTKDTSSRKILRYRIAQWNDLPGMTTGDGSWVDSKNVFIIEILPRGKKINVSFVLGKGNQEVRKKIHDVARNRVSKETNISKSIVKAKLTPTWTHITTKIILSEIQYKNAIRDEKTAEDIAILVFSNATKFLESTLPFYDEIIREALISENLD